MAFAMNGGKYSWVKANKSQTPVPAKTCNKAPVYNYNCNCNQDPHVSEDIKEIKTKLEQLVALVNKTLTPRPTTTPGKLKLCSGFF